MIYRVRVRRGSRKKPVPKGQVYGKPKHQGINQLKFQRSLQSVAEERVGRRCPTLRVLNSYWIAQDATFKFYEVILIDPCLKGKSSIMERRLLSLIFRQVFVAMLVSTGFAERTRNTVNYVVWHPPDANPAVLAMAIVTRWPLVDLAVNAGNVSNNLVFVVIVKQRRSSPTATRLTKFLLFLLDCCCFAFVRLPTKKKN